MANQNETRQPELWTLAFVFTLFFSSVRRPKFQKIWDFLCELLRRRCFNLSNVISLLANQLVSAVMQREQWRQ